MSSVNPYAPPSAEIADVAVHEASPALWNPNAAACWSLIFSPVFGGILHMKNWQAMGRPEEAASSRNWVIGTLLVLVATIVMAVVLPDSKFMDLLSRFFGFGTLIAWYYAIGKSQNAAVLARYGKDYARKGWGKPLSLAVLALIGFLVLAVIIGGAAAALA